MLGFKKLFKNGQEQGEAAVMSPSNKVVAPSKSGSKPSRSPEAAKNETTLSSNMMLTITLNGIFSRLPDALKAAVNKEPSDEDFIELPAHLVTQQLSKGKAHITFQQLKELASGDFFDSTSDMDSSLISLPLSEIIPQLKAGKSTAKKPATPKVADGTPDEPENTKPKTTVSASHEPLRPSAPPPFVKPPTSDSMKSQSFPPRSASPSPASSSEKPAARSITPKIGQEAPAKENLQGTIPVALNRLVEAWPEAVMKETLAFNNVDELKIEFPAGKIAPAIQQGKITFNWSQVRSWIRPEIEKAVSDQDGTELDVPLSIMVPLFLNHQKPVAKRNSIAEMEDIPDLFGAADFGNDSSEEETAAAPAAPEPKVSPLAVSSSQTAPGNTGSGRIPISFRDEEKDAPMPSAPAAKSPPTTLAASGPLTLGKVFLQPEKTKWTMQEIVDITTLFPGVCGALITMNDGLLVAASLPKPLSADKIAAFVPKMLQKNLEICSQMGLGTPNLLTLSFASGPAVVITSGKSNFLVFGNNEHPLPMVQLNAIAKHLEAHTK